MIASAPVDAERGDLLLVLAARWRSLLLVPVLGGLVGLGASFLMKPTYISAASFLPPQQQGGAASALAGLGALSSLAGAAGGGLKSPIDQYVALMQSTQVSDRLIDQFKLIDAYDLKWRDEARRALERHAIITAGKKDGLIRIEVEDTDAKRAADIANQYVAELRRLTSTLAVTEAQQRRVFFDRKLQDTRASLERAQAALQDTGVGPGSIKAEPKAAAEAYARLKAELTAAEVRLQTMRSVLADGSAEMQQQGARVHSLRDQLAQLEGSSQEAAAGPHDADYVTRYREFKYQETLFDLYARQFELARADESREGALIQVVDTAQPAERKAKPRRRLVALVFGLVAEALFALAVVARHRVGHHPATRARWLALREAMRRRGRVPG